MRRTKGHFAEFDKRNDSEGKANKKKRKREGGQKQYSVKESGVLVPGDALIKEWTFLFCCVVPCEGSSEAIGFHVSLNGVFPTWQWISICVV